MINFSDLFKQTSGHCHYSPDNSLLANSVSFRLVIRDSKTLEVVHIWKCLDEINKVQWSPDSSLILVVLKKRNTIQIFNIDDTSWKCKIDFANISIADALWLADSRHFMTIDELAIRIQLWSLISKTVSILTGVKSLNRGVSCLEDRVAILESRTRKGSGSQLRQAGSQRLGSSKSRDEQSLSLVDYCSLLQYNPKCHTWEKLSQFKLCTKNATDVSFTNDGLYLVIKDGPIHNRNIYIYDSVNGTLKSSINRTDEESAPRSSFGLVANAPGAGFPNSKPLECSLHVNTENMFAFGNIQKPEISLVSKLSFKNICNLVHKEVVDKINAAVYFEVSRNINNNLGNFTSQLELDPIGPTRTNPNFQNSEQASLFAAGSKFEIADLPYHLPVDTCVSSSISWLRVSHNNEFLASQRADMKRVIYIWGNLIDDNNSIKAPHSIIETTQNINCACWSPTTTKLAICTGNDKIYLWSEASILSIENPNDIRFCVTGLRWSKDGKYLILMSRTQMMVCFV